MKLFEKLIGAQYRRPAGLLGRWIGKQMAADHLPENLWTAALLQPGPADHVLEVGFGPGSAIETLYRNPVQNCVSRPDPRRRFLPDHVEYGAPAECSCDPAGIFDLYCADAAGLPFAEGTFDKAYSIHTIYF